MRALLLLALSLLTACHSLPPLPEWQGPDAAHAPGAIVELRTGKYLTPAQLVAQLAGAERVLVGEQHDNPDHHAVQLWLLQALAERRAQGSLLLEMLNPAQQTKAAQVQAAHRQGQAPADLAAALDWQPGWPWPLYGALLGYAVQQPYPLLAANLDRSEIARIYQQAPALPGEASGAPVVRKQLLKQIDASHCGQLPAAQWPAMLAVQQQRDRRMAERLLAAPQPAMLLAGAFHVRRDLGVPLHLQDLAADGQTRVLILASVGEALTSSQADFVWYTPAQPEQDPCAEWRAKAPGKG
jgi:uncharacterized iron-regulated protein